MSKPPLAIEHLRTAALRPYAHNARTHSPKQIAQIAASIREFGFNNPVLVDRDGEIIAGHGRVAAAKKLGLDTVPCVRLEHLNEAQKRAYILADNRLAEKAGWDREILSIELQHLTSIDVDFDVTLTGFEMAEIDLLLGAGGESDAKADPADTVPEIVPGSAITRPGDLWQIGRHRLICGDSLVAETYDRLLAGEKAQMVFTDPPYNVKIDGHVSGLGAAKHREFAFASGEMSEDEFTHFLARVFDNLASHAADGAIHFVCMDWRHQGEVLAAAHGTYTELKNLCVWAKTNGGMGSLYRSQHELVFVFKSGVAPHINNVELGKHGRYPASLPLVWETGGRIPREMDRHVFPDSGCLCLGVPLALWIQLKGDFSLQTVLDIPVRNYLIGNSLVERGEPWPHGDRSHGVAGVLEFYGDLLGNSDPMTIANFLLSIVKGKVRGHWPCLCGSGKIIRNCHKDAVEQLRLVPTWVLAQSGCMIVDAIKRRN